MRSEPSVLHLDLDAFFASVEQRDKPSLRGKPVIVGGIGPRGVVSTASYEARAFGVHSAMSTARARALCPHAAFLNGRFDAYRRTSRRVMSVLREVSPVIEPLSLDEAFVDLAAGPLEDLSPAVLDAAMRDLKAAVRDASGGIAGSAGVATSKLIAKIASDLDKPDGLRVVPAGTEQDLIRPMQVTVIPGVGPATGERLRRAGIHTVADAESVSENELVRLLGKSHGHALYRLCRADDDRPVEAHRESKSVSVEDTFETDLVDPELLRSIVARHATQVCERLRAARLSGRTVTVKIRLYDFTTHTRSATLAGPTDDPRAIVRLARQLVDDVDTTAGVRLLGVGVSGLADWIQQDLFGDDEPAPAAAPAPETAELHTRAPYAPGRDVVHTAHGPGWVWGCGLGRVTVRFETADTPPGPVRTFRADDPDLCLAPEPDGTDTVSA
ncbi:MAG: DNA polymerase IV [Nocardioidaceae bacterium]